MFCKYEAVEMRLYLALRKTTLIALHPATTADTRRRKPGAEAYLPPVTYLLLLTISNFKLWPLS